MKKTFLLAFALFFAALSTAQAQAQTNDERLTQEFMERQRAQDAAEEKKDIAALDRFFNDDFIFIAADGRVHDKKKFLDDLKADDSPPSPQTFKYEDFKARAHGKTTIVNYILVVSGKDKDGKDYTNRYRMSVIWIKHNKNWRISNFHTTRVRA